MRALALAALIGSVTALAEAQDPYVGTFSNGELTVQLRPSGTGYEGVALIQGHQFPLQAQRSGNGLAGSYTYQGQASSWTAALQGDVLTMLVDGQTVALRRQAAGAAAQPAQPLGGPVRGGAPQGQLSAQGQEWFNHLAGKRLTQMESYSSGSAGGYSNRNVWDLCRDGRFYYSGSSSVSVDVGGASGYAGGPEQGAGQWRIIEQSGLVGIELRWSGGNVSQHRLDYQDGATYADGTRIYVTPDNGSC